MSKIVDLLETGGPNKLPVELLNLVDLPGCPVDLLESGRPAKVTYRQTSSTICSKTLYEQGVWARELIVRMMRT